MPTYRIYVECTSTERFDVEADSYEEAKRKYIAGDCTLEGDEVEGRCAKYIETGDEDPREFGRVNSCTHGRDSVRGPGEVGYCKECDDE